MSTLFDLQTQMGRAVNYEVKKINDPAIKIVSNCTGTHMVFTNGEQVLLSDAGWELVKTPGLSPMDEHKAKKLFMFAFISEFEAENIEKVDMQIWPESHVDEMLSDLLLLKVLQLSPLGAIRSIRDIWVTIPTNQTWMTTTRHQEYLDLLDEGILRFPT